MSRDSCGGTTKQLLLKLKRLMANHFKHITGGLDVPSAFVTGFAKRGLICTVINI